MLFGVYNNLFHSNIESYRQSQQKNRPKNHQKHELTTIQFVVTVRIERAVREETAVVIENAQLGES